MYVESDQKLLEDAREHRRVAIKLFRMMTERINAFIAYVDTMRERFVALELREPVPKECRLYWAEQYDLNEEEINPDSNQPPWSKYGPEKFVDGYEWESRVQDVWNASMTALQNIGREVDFASDLLSRGLWKQCRPTLSMWRELLPPLAREADFHDFVRREIHARSLFHSDDYKAECIWERESIRYQELIVQQAFCLGVANGKSLKLARALKGRFRTRNWCQTKRVVAASLSAGEITGRRRA